MAEQEEIRPNAFADKVSTIAGSLAFVGTIVALGIGFPAVGAWMLGALALHAGGGVLGAVAAGAVGAVVGFLPFVAVDQVGRKKDPSYGTLEAMCVPAAIVGETVNCLLSPKYGLKKLKGFFARAAEKPAEAPAPAPAPVAQPAAPAAKPEANTP